ncbi:MAG: hypothetical protein ABIJ40_20900 [Bacteroidota bacterium]
MEFDESIDSFERGGERMSVSDLYFSKATKRCVEASVERISSCIAEQKREELRQELDCLSRTIKIFESRPDIAINIDKKAVNDAVEAATFFLRNKEFRINF